MDNLVLRSVITSQSSKPTLLESYISGRIVGLLALFGIRLLYIRRDIADLIKERRSTLLDTSCGIKVHSSTPGLPILALRCAILCPTPFVEAELYIGFAGGTDKLSEGEQLFIGKLETMRRDQGGDIEAADKRPDAAVVVFAGLVVFFVSWQPIWILGSDVWEEVGGQINCKVFIFAQSSALCLDPGDELFRACGWRDSGKDGQAVAEQIEAFTFVDFVRPHRIIWLVSEDETLVHMSLLSFALDGEPSHFFAEALCAGVLPEESQVGINDCVDVKAIAENPLFIAPVACGQLRYDDAVAGALV